MLSKSAHGSECVDSFRSAGEQCEQHQPDPEQEMPVGRAQLEARSGVGIDVVPHAENPRCTVPSVRPADAARGSPSTDKRTCWPGCRSCRSPWIAGAARSELRRPEKHGQKTTRSDCCRATCHMSASVSIAPQRPAHCMARLARPAGRC